MTSTPVPLSYGHTHFKTWWDGPDGSKIGSCHTTWDSTRWTLTLTKKNPNEFSASLSFGYAPFKGGLVKIAMISDMSDLENSGKYLNSCMLPDSPTDMKFDFNFLDSGKSQLAFLIDRNGTLKIRAEIYLFNTCKAYVRIMFIHIL